MSEQAGGPPPVTDGAGGDGRLRLDYVSPLPPVRTGIADYSVDLLDALATHAADLAEVRVARVDGQEVDGGLVRRWDPVPLRELHLEAGRLPVYHLGNNLFHEAILDAAVERPGVVVLHDVFLHHLLQERTLAHGDMAGYVAALTRDHGWVGGAVSLPPRWSAYGRAGLFALPAQKSLLERQKGVLVHSEWARRFLEEEGIDVPVATMPMVMPLPPLDGDLDARAATLRSRWGVGRGSCLLGSFGFQTPIKRTATAVRALARPGMESVELVVGGALSAELDLVGLARELGVEERVHCVGFLPPEDFAAAIRACDVTVNLRHPTAGETSASLLRILALGRTSLVSDYAQFRDFDPEVVLRIPLGEDPASGAAGSDEVVALGEAVAALAREPERGRAMGEAARRLVARRHDPAVAARAFCAAIRAVLEAEVGGESGPVRRRSTPTTLTWGRVESRLTVDGVDDWAPGERRVLVLRLENQSFARLLAARHGDGGVMFEIRLLATDETGGLVDLRGDAPWVELPVDVEPGGTAAVEVALRRPSRPAVLEIRPHVVGGRGFGASGGGIYRRDLPVGP